MIAEVLSINVFLAKFVSRDVRGFSDRALPWTRAGVEGQGFLVEPLAPFLSKLTIACSDVMLDTPLVQAG